MRPIVLGTLAALLALAPSARAQIVNVTVNNSGFETPILSTPGDYIGEGNGTSTPGYPIPSWVATADVMGVQNGQVGSLYGGSGSGLQGNNFGWDDGVAPFYQILSGPGSTIEAGTYTLTVALGQRPGVPDMGAVLSLYSASGSSLGSLLASSGIVGATPLGAGTFSDYTLTLNVLPGDPAIGQSIAIELAGANNKSSGLTGNDDFDNVRLTFAAPEPSTYALMLGGLAVLGFMMRRKAVRVPLR